MKEGNYTPEKGRKLWSALQKIYNRRQPPIPFVDGETFPWQDAEFSRRMLELHLDQSHGAASRPTAEIDLQVEFLLEELELHRGSRLLDITCGPGFYACRFADRGMHVVGFDISPYSLKYAREACKPSVSICQADFHNIPLARDSFDAAIFLYGQFAVIPKEDALEVMDQISSVLKPGGKLALELLNPEKVDRQESTWWFTDEGGLWGEHPYLHLGERHWDENLQASIERYYVVDIQTGDLREYALADQVYTEQDVATMAKAVGLEVFSIQPAWGGLPLSDAEEWILYVLRKPEAENR
jgi:SAM-dependent methyltransferase